MISSTRNPGSTIVRPVTDWYVRPDDAFCRLEGDQLAPGPLCGEPWDPDRTVQTFRDPVGEWIGRLGLHKNESDGIGMSEAVPYDASGRIGRGASSILIEARRPKPGDSP